MAYSHDKENAFHKEFDKKSVFRSSFKRNRLDDVSQMMDFDQSPKPSSPWLSSVALQNNSPLRDSPFNLFKVRKRRSRTNPSPENECKFPGKDFNSTTPTRNAFNPNNANRENSFSMDIDKNVDSKMSFRSPGTLNHVIQNSIQNPNLIGDFSKPCVLPTIKGKHEDLLSVTPETIVKILMGEYQGSYKIIDCRYPYEYSAGHVMGAKNIYTKDALLRELLPADAAFKKNELTQFVIFYCEFSSQRAPKMYRFLRGRDRELNADSYPALFYPEVYLLEGGYKSFYESFKEHCDPQGYKIMLDKDNTQDMVHFRAKCRSDTSEYRRPRSKVRSGLKF